MSPNIKLVNATDVESRPSHDHATATGRRHPSTLTMTVTPSRSPFGSKIYTRQLGKTTVKTTLICGPSSAQQTPEKQPPQAGNTTETTKHAANDHLDEDGPSLALLMPPMVPLAGPTRRPPPHIDVAGALGRLAFLRLQASQLHSATVPSSYVSPAWTDETGVQGDRPALARLLLDAIQSPVMITPHDLKAEGGKHDEASEALIRLQALRREGNRLVNMI